MLLRSPRLFCCRASRALLISSRSAAVLSSSARLRFRALRLLVVEDEVVEEEGGFRAFLTLRDGRLPDRDLLSFS